MGAAPMRWGELVQAVTDWQARTGIDPSDLPVVPTLNSSLITPPVWPTKFWPHLKVISLERGVVLDLEEKP